MSDAKSPPDLPMGEILATIRRIIAEDDQAGANSVSGAAAPAAGGATEPTAAAPHKTADDEVLELTAAVTEDGSVRQLAPLAGSTHHHLSEQNREPAAPATAIAEPETQPEPRLTIPPEAAAGAAQEPAEPLLSETAAAAAAASFAGLAAAPREPAPPREPAMIGERPLEASVRELLRPLLRSWLDQNLPDIVERLVKAEIARLSRRAE